MAYGQTGTGKTFTLGRLGDEVTSDRGIMVRAMEDILADISPENDSITVSYLQVKHYCLTVLVHILIDADLYTPFYKTMLSWTSMSWR